jgi:menaquinone-9 beta-reductase
MPTLQPITIVGGGLAGLTLGIGLRQRGIPVTVWETGHYPRHRVCGEFISGCGPQILERLGLLAHLNQAGALSARTAVFVSRNTTSPIRPLPRTALCLSRYAMDNLLAEHFRELGGKLHDSQRWPESDFLQGVVRASGRRLQPTENGWRWFGLKVHAQNVSLVADLEMHLLPNAYVGLCRLKDGEVNVCGLFRRSAVVSTSSPKTAGSSPSPPLEERVGERRSWQETLRGHPGTALYARLANAIFDETSFCSVAGLSLRPQPAVAHSECCIGDALTMIPPVTGNGMSMAFESAELAIGPLAAYSREEISWTQAQHAIARVCDQNFAQRLFWARWLQWLMFAPALQGYVGSLALRSGLLWRLMFAKTR